MVPVWVVRDGIENGCRSMTAILGISAFYHDSAAALVVDGRIVAAAQEERFTRIKHDPAFPARAIEYCLREAGLIGEELDYVAFYDKPLTKFERLLETYLAYVPSGFRSFGWRCRSGSKTSCTCAELCGEDWRRNPRHV